MVIRPNSFKIYSFKIELIEMNVFLSDFVSISLVCGLGLESGRFIQYHPGSRRHFGGALY